jgi:hypothetical protein
MGAVTEGLLARDLEQQVTVRGGLLAGPSKELNVRAQPEPVHVFQERAVGGVAPTSRGVVERIDREQADRAGLSLGKRDRRAPVVAAELDDPLAWRHAAGSRVQRQGLLPR